MVCNNSLTVYHKGLDNTTKLETWTRFNYENVWFFGGKGAGINKGYDNANDFQCRIPYDKNNGLDYSNFSVGDIVIEGTITDDITATKELKKYQCYTIVSLNNNNFGTTKHIHIGGK